jgi:hypothetical protein
MKMKDEKSETIGSKIQKVKADNPSPDFTAVVMKVIMEPENEVAADSSLKSLVRIGGMEKSPEGFVRNVMAQVTAHDFQTEFKPVISRRSWIMIGFSATCLIILQVFTYQSAPSYLGLTSYALYFGSKLTRIFGGVPSPYLFTFFAVSALVVIDYFFDRRSKSASS